MTTLGLGRGLPPGLRPHRAGYDALVTARLLIHLATATLSGALSSEDLRQDQGDGNATLF